jgi:sugar lactone lactonase YvrE
MKHLFIFILFALALTSCDKEEEPGPEPEENTVTISSFQPAAGQVGITVTINGNHFDGTNKLNNTVKFNGVAAQVLEATVTQLRVVVPTGASTGKITVNVAGKAAQSTNAFVVTPDGTVPDDPTGWIVSTFQTGNNAFDLPRGATTDEDGNMYITDQNVIKKVQPNGTVTLYAGTGAKGSNDGNALTEASFDQPTGLAFDSEGNLFVADQFNHVIRKIATNGQVTTFAGKADEPGMINAIGENARFSSPYAIAIDAQNNLYVSDHANNMIRKITPGREVLPFAGNGSQTNSDAAVGGNAGIPRPGGITMDADGILYVTERGGGRIRKIDPSGTVAVSTIGGELSVNFMPSGIVVDKDKNVYIAYTGMNKIKKITPGGPEQDFAGTGDPGYVEGAAAVARFNFPEGLILKEESDGKKTFYVIDRQNKKIRKLVFVE